MAHNTVDINFCVKAHIEYKNIYFKNGLTTLRPIIVHKRNDSLFDKNQQIQLQSQRANTDIQPIIVYTTCSKFISKCATKAEKISSVVQDAFISIVQKLQGTNDI